MIESGVYCGKVKSRVCLVMVAPLRVSMGPETLSELGSVNNSQYQYIGEVS